jgi:hypothetical protein
MISVGIGLDLDIGDLVEIDPQPDCPDGVQAAQVDFGADATLQEQGLYAVLIWEVIDLDMEDYATGFLAQFGLNAFNRRAITITLPDVTGVEHVYSGYAYRPRTLGYRLSPTDIRMTLSRLYIVG